MHFHSKELRSSSLIIFLLMIFLVLFTFTAILSLSQSGKDITSSFSSDSPTESNGSKEEIESISSFLQEITDIFADGFDIREVETVMPVSVPEGYGAVIETTRDIKGDIISADEMLSITNKTLSAAEIDIDRLMSKYPVTPVSSPTVIIYHTHTSEGYEKNANEYYPLGKSGVTENEALSVTAVGEALKARLENYGINVIHIKDSFDSPSRSGSFKRSAAAVMKAAENKNVALVIDLHRGILVQTGGDRIKPTVYCNGRKAAQIGLISCYDKDGTLGCPGWESNLSLSLSLSRELNSFSPLLTLPVSLESQKYNLYLPYPCIMTEIGTDVNTIEEAKLSAILLGDAIASLICIS